MSEHFVQERVYLYFVFCSKLVENKKLSIELNFRLLHPTIFHRKKTVDYHLFV